LEEWVVESGWDFFTVGGVWTVAARENAGRGRFTFCVAIDMLWF